MGEQVMANVFACHGSLYGDGINGYKWDGMLWSCQCVATNAKTEGIARVERRLESNHVCSL